MLDIKTFIIYFVIDNTCIVSNIDKLIIASCVRCRLISQAKCAGHVILPNMVLILNCVISLVNDDQMRLVGGF